MDNRLTMSASDIRIDNKMSARSTSLDEISSHITFATDSQSDCSDVSDVSDFSDISDEEAYELSFDSSSEDESKSKHRKSSSFSSSPFPNISSPSWQQHRKRNSDDNHKKFTIPKYTYLQNKHRRQNSDDGGRDISVQKSKFIENYQQLQKILYTDNSSFSPYEIDPLAISDGGDDDTLEVGRGTKLLSDQTDDFSKKNISLVLKWVIGGLVMMLLCSLITLQSFDVLTVTSSI